MILAAITRQAAKKSKVVGAVKENQGPQRISWYCFLGKNEILDYFYGMG